MEIKLYLKKRADLINKYLYKFLPKDSSLLSRSMRYSIFAGGKRLRPILVLAGAEICGGNILSVVPAACSLEFIHTYSLIHDDLPSMDNDDLRRGKPTNHKKFGEATAILTGDALLTDAFKLLSECIKNKNIKPSNIVKAIKILSTAAGSSGMVVGQTKDTVESNNWHKKNKSISIRNLDFIHKNKTAALIRASLGIGATLVNASKKQLEALEKYGENIGLAFQIMDDILDITADKKLLGKKGSDKDNNKLTFPAVYGLEKSKQILEDCIKKAKDSIKLFGKKSEYLNKIADYMIQRKY